MTQRGKEPTWAGSRRIMLAMMSLSTLYNYLYSMTVSSALGLTPILGGALWVSARRPEPPRPLTSAQWAIGLLAGFAMGYSSRLAFGCNVGAMVSGISTGSLHGWLWVPMAFLGTLVGLRVRQRFF